MKKNLLILFCLVNLANITAQLSITVGNAGFPSGSTGSSPINIFYRSHHCQILYTQSELISAGWNGQGIISKLGFNVFGTTTEALPNFNVQLKNTSAIDVSVYDNAGLTNVYTSASYLPSAGGFDMLNLSTNFLWDGTSNVLVDVCFDQVSAYTSTGEVYMFNYTSGNSEYQFTRDDNAPQCSVSTGQIVSGSKPQIKFEMTSPTPCAGIPNSGIANSDKALVCPNTSFNLSLSNASVENGINYQWQSSADGSIWNNMGTNQTNWDFTVNSIADTTYYRCVSTCSNSALTNTSMPIVVNYNPLINCYCMPSYSWDCNGDKFWDFSLANIVGQSNNCDAGGFSDWTSYSFADVNVNAGSTYTLSVNTSSTGLAGDAAVGAWIDYNQNAIFENSEFTYLGFGSGLSYSNTLTVPVTAATGSVRMRLKLDANYASAATVLDPCDNNNFSSYGQILDYKVNITAAPACSGAPNAGDAISTETAVCQNVPYTLDLINNSVASNITYQWQSSPNGTAWTNLGIVQNTIPYSVLTQSVTTYYRCISTCTTSAPISSTSTPVVVTQNLPTTCYCTPATVSCVNTSISNIMFVTLSDNPVCDMMSGYIFNSTNTVTINANQSYTISTTFNSQATAYLGAWIDYNQDGIFDSNEYSDLGNGPSGTLTGTINIPFTALAGNTRMRFKTESAFTNAPILNPCTSSNFDGQTLDYPVYINAVTPCTGAPNAGDATSSVSTICENRPFTLDLVNNDQVSNISYQWQSSTDNVIWTNIGSSQTTVPYTITSQSITSYYRCLTTCTTSALTSTSTALTISQNAVTACYCIPDPMDCTGSDLINYVAFATMTNTSTCDGAIGYSDFTGSVPSATTTAGQTYTITTVLGYMYGEHTHAWIDYNQNGIFDSSEYTDLGPNSGNDTISYTITIPINATPGTTRMRVRNISGNSLGSSDACITPTFAPRSALNSVMGSGTSGESEDYFVTILPPDCSIINFPPTIALSGNLDICPGNSTSLDLSTPLQAATGITYQWKYYNGTAYVNSGSASATSSFTDTPTTNTQYFCEILCNGNLIKNTDTVLVKVQQITTSPITTSVTCNGLNNGAITMNAFASGSVLNYTWTPNVGSTDIVSSLTAGTYTVFIVNGFNCAITQTVSVAEPIAISSTLTQTNVSCYGLNDGIASVTVNGGTSPLSFSWSPTGGNALTATNLAAGNYSFNISDGNGCTATQSVTIIQPGIFSASIIGSSPSICEQLADTVKSTIVGGTAPYIYNWIELPSTSVSTNPNYEYVTSVGTHSYNLSVTDNSGCIVNSNTISIVVNPSSNFSGTVTTSGGAPVSGKVVLFKYLPFYTKFDSVAGQNIGASGDFLFTSFTSGIYIIKAIPTATNMQISYGADPGDTAVAWKDAKHIIHGCAVNDIQNIFVPAFISLASGGQGSLSGKIIQGAGYDSTQRVAGGGSKPLIPGGPIGGIIVKGGKNPGGQMFVQTVTDSNGNYSISGLPDNTGNESYFILVDIPGLDTNNTYHKVIISNNSYSGLDFVVDSAKINPIPSSVISVNDIVAVENQIKVFPNPASDYVTIQYNLKSNSLVKIELFDMLGRSVKMMLPEVQQGIETHKQSWQTNDLKSGLYFIKMTINGSESTIKLSVTN